MSILLSFLLNIELYFLLIFHRYLINKLLFIWNVYVNDPIFSD